MISFAALTVACMVVLALPTLQTFRSAGTEFIALDLHSESRRGFNPNGQAEEALARVMVVIDDIISIYDLTESPTK